MLTESAGRRGGTSAGKGNRQPEILFTQLSHDKERERRAGRFSTKCPICCRVKISSLKAYEVAPCRLARCYSMAGCNYSVWTLLHCAFRDEKERKRVEEELDGIKGRIKPEREKEKCSIMFEAKGHCRLGPSTILNQLCSL